MDDAESIFSNPVFHIAGMFKAAYSDDTPKIPEGLSEEGKDFLRQWRSACNVIQDLAPLQLS